MLQAPSPFLERLHLDAAELDPAPPVKQPGGLFSSSEEGREPPASSHSMVGSMLSRVRAASPSGALVPRDLTSLFLGSLARLQSAEPESLPSVFQLQHLGMHVATNAI